jgi:hypothetical protein
MAGLCHVVTAVLGFFRCVNSENGEDLTDISFFIYEVVILLEK